MKKEMQYTRGLYTIVIQAMFLLFFAAIFSSNVYLNIFENNFWSPEFWKPVMITTMIMSVINWLCYTFRNTVITYEEHENKPSYWFSLIIVLSIPIIVLLVNLFA